MQKKIGFHQSNPLPQESELPELPQPNEQQELSEYNKNKEEHWLQEIQSYVAPVFIPANNIQEADEILQTIDLYESIVCFSDFSIEEFTRALSCAGYKYQLIEGKPFWLLKTPL